MDRVTGDHMGMLATVMNCLSMQDALEQLGAYCRVMSALPINAVCEDYIRRRAVRHLEKGRIVLFAAGTGSPFFTTVKHDDAVRYDVVSFDEAVNKRLGVMDQTAIVMCRDNDLPVKVFNMNNAGDLMRVVLGENVGTTVRQSVDS